MRHFIALLMFVFCVGSNALAQQAAFPSKPLRIVVPNAAGGGTDAFARVVASKLGEELGQSVIVENKPGAQGGIGTTFGAKSAPDGYTMTLAFTSTFAVNPFVHKDLGYDPLKDFAGVALGVTQPYLIVTYPDAPYNSLKEFADFARKKTGGATFASKQRCCTSLTKTQRQPLSSCLGEISMSWWQVCLPLSHW
jgi:tripartite-type tricarboxylate transporter receptor subunit TctC